MAHLGRRTDTEEIRRVAVLAYTEYPWDPRVRQEAETLVEDGYAVHVIALRPRSGPSPSHLGGVHLHEIPIAIRRGGPLRYVFQYVTFTLLAALKLLSFHIRRHFDLVHVHSLPDFLVFAALPLKARRVPVLLDLHEAFPEILAARMHVPMHAFLVRMAKVLEQLSARFADHVVTSNDGIRRLVVERGLPESRVTTVYSPVAVHPAAVRAQDLTVRLRLPKGNLVVHAGGINPERDLETLVRAIARLPADPGLHLVIAGDGDPVYLRALLMLAETIGLSGRVHYVGKLSMEDARALMSLSSVGLVTLEANPLTEVALPTRIIEYARLEKPLVVPALRLLRELLGESVRYYRPGDPDSLAAELGATLREPDGGKGAAERARYISGRFSASQVKAQLRGVLRAVEGHHVG